MRVRDRSSRRHWVWNPRMVLSIVLGNLAMIASIVAIRTVDGVGPELGVLALGLVGGAVVWWTWECQSTSHIGDGKVHMHNAVDRIAFWFSLVLGVGFAIYAAFGVAMAFLD